jgi:hypothetical protein
MIFRPLKVAGVILDNRLVAVAIDGSRSQRVLGIRHESANVFKKRER